MPNAGDILAAYGRVLETKTDLLLTESQLPASREDIKAILVAEALKAQRAGSADYLNTIRTCHSLLSTFVPDEVVQAISNDVSGYSGALLTSASDGARLIREFDAFMQHLSK